MTNRLSKCNSVSIFIEVLGILIMTVGTIFEYVYAKDLFLLFITIGGIIFSIGSGFVNKFPWSVIREANNGGRKEEIQGS
jgi:Na+/melibiose symporter-like transporter